MNASCIMGAGLYQVQRQHYSEPNEREQPWETIARCATYEQAVDAASEEYKQGWRYTRVFCDPIEVASALALQRVWLVWTSHPSMDGPDVWSVHASETGAIRAAESAPKSPKTQYSADDGHEVKP